MRSSVACLPQKTARSNCLRVSCNAAAVWQRLETKKPQVRYSSIASMIPRPIRCCFARSQPAIGPWSKARVSSAWQGFPPRPNYSLRTGSQPRRPCFTSTSDRPAQARSSCQGHVMIRLLPAGRMPQSLYSARLCHSYCSGGMSVCKRERIELRPRSQQG